MCYYWKDFIRTTKESEVWEIISPRDIKPLFSHEVRKNQTPTFTSTFILRWRRSFYWCIKTSPRQNRRNPAPVLACGVSACISPFPVDPPRIGVEQISADNKVKIQLKIGNDWTYSTLQRQRFWGVLSSILLFQRVYMELCGYPRHTMRLKKTTRTHHSRSKKSTQNQRT